MKFLLFWFFIAFLFLPTQNDGREYHYNRPQLPFQSGEIYAQQHHHNHQGQHAFGQHAQATSASSAAARSGSHFTVGAHGTQFDVHMIRSQPVFVGYQPGNANGPRGGGAPVGNYAPQQPYAHAQQVTPHVNPLYTTLHAPPQQSYAQHANYQQQQQQYAGAASNAYGRSIDVPHAYAGGGAGVGGGQHGGGYNGVGSGAGVGGGYSYGGVGGAGIGGGQHGGGYGGAGGGAQHGGGYGGAGAGVGGGQHGSGYGGAGAQNSGGYGGVGGAGVGGVQFGGGYGGAGGGAQHAGGYGGAGVGRGQFGGGPQHGGVGGGAAQFGSYNGAAQAVGPHNGGNQYAGANFAGAHSQPVGVSGPNNGGFGGGSGRGYNSANPAAEAASQSHGGQYVSQSEAAQLDHYPYKQLNAGDPRAYQRHVTVCYGNGHCEQSTLAPGQIDPKQFPITTAARAQLAPASDKCRRISEANLAAAQGYNYNDASGGQTAAGTGYSNPSVNSVSQPAYGVPNFNAGSQSAANFGPQSAISGSQSAFGGPQGSIGGPQSAIGGPIRPRDRRLYPYSEVPIKQDPFN